MTTIKTTCRACGNSLSPWLDLGEIYPSAFTDNPYPHFGMEHVRLNLVRCGTCELVQLDRTYDRDKMYRNYWYESSMNTSMVRELFDIATNATFIAQVGDGDTVMDIGCNDGTLLSFYGKHTNRIGFDPAANLEGKASERCDLFVNDYFKASPDFKAKAKVITSIAMFYDLDDPWSFVKDISYCLAPNGIWIVQMMDLRSMIDANAWDNIVHEHLEYWSLKSMAGLLGTLNLEVFKVEYNKVNGGSIRAFCCHRGSRPIDPSVAQAIHAEASFIDDKTVAKFKANIGRISSAIRACIATCRSLGKCVCALGASTKGNTFLQVSGINHRDIKYIGEVSHTKFGKHTVGSWIPIIPETHVMDKADIMLVLPWHFISGIKDKFNQFVVDGGKLIVAMPEPTIITSRGSEVIW